MVFGKTDEEEIQLNEETYWSGGRIPRSSRVDPRLCPRSEAHLRGQLQDGHILFGRYLMGYPVEQMKYQSFGSAGPPVPVEGCRDELRHEPTWTRPWSGRPTFRAASVSPGRSFRVPWTRSSPSGSRPIGRGRSRSRPSSRAKQRSPLQLCDRLFPMDGLRPTASSSAGVRGLHGCAGRAPLREPAQGPARGGDDEPGLGRAQRPGADAVTLLIAAATNFVNYKDVGGDPGPGSRRRWRTPPERRTKVSRRPTSRSTGACSAART